MLERVRGPEYRLVLEPEPEYRSVPELARELRLNRCRL